MHRKETARKFIPALRTDAVDDQKKAILTNPGTQSATLTDFCIFKAPSDCKITKVSLVVQTTVPAHATNKWSFQVANKLYAVNLLATAADTSATPMTAYVPFDLTPDQNFYLDEGNTLTLTATKSNSAPNLVLLSVTVEYQVDGLANEATSTSTTTTTTTTTSTTTSTTTTTT